MPAPYFDNKYISISRPESTFIYFACFVFSSKCLFGAEERAPPSSRSHVDARYASHHRTARGQHGRSARRHAIQLLRDAIHLQHGQGAPATAKDATPCSAIIAMPPSDTDFERHLSRATLLSRVKELRTGSL